MHSISALAHRVGLKLLTRELKQHRLSREAFNRYLRRLHPLHPLSNNHDALMALYLAESSRPHKNNVNKT